MALFIPAARASDTPKTQDNRWVYVCDKKDASGTKLYYDRETVSYISDNQVGVWAKTVSPGSEELQRYEIACGSNMFHLIEEPANAWGVQSKTTYIVGKWMVTPPDSEVYLLSKHVCRKPGKTGR